MSNPPNDLPSGVENQPPVSSRISFPVMGAGASAGGLQALQELLGALPADTGMGFVIVQHLAPDHPSSLAEILSRSTQMPVREVSSEPMVEPNHVYIVPPGRDMVIAGGRLMLIPQKRHSLHRGIDQFFRSLAEDCGHLAIGVVLSGCANDGTLGLEEIKTAGGVTFAQDDSALQNSMPHSAIATGCVDYVLSPEGIARELVRISRHPYIGPPEGAEDKGIPDHIRIVEIVREAMGVDFTHYKSSTLRRRITRRMMLHRYETTKDYEELLRQNPAEVEALYQDILISVTSFFRNPDAFDAIARDVFPKLIAACPANEPVRIWTAGCASGEEAYSLAMVFAECAEAANSPARLQLFATDLNAACIEKARMALYPRSISADVSEYRLRRFFVEEGGGYRINKSIRERCIFSRHNVLADPPFSRVDFISCRNLLIYLEPVLQQRIMSLFHYSLKLGGYLWLGSSESLGTSRPLFEPSDVRHTIFVRRGSGPPPVARFRPPAISHLSLEPLSQRKPVHVGLHRDAERIMLEKYAPPGVVLSASLEIVQFQGDTGPYLAPAAGTASLHLLKMLREGLANDVREAIKQAEKSGAAIRLDSLRVRSNGGFRTVSVEVIPIKAGAGKSGGFVVLFDDPRQAQPSTSGRSWFSRLWDRVFASAGSRGVRDEEVAHLTEELSATRESLQAVIEQHEATNEELQSANEEAQSANEEMQSINEELETSKEEIEASNEELAALNNELSSRNDELNHVNEELRLSRDFAHSIVDGVSIPLVVLDREQRVRTAGRAFYETFRTTPAVTEGRFLRELGNGQWSSSELYKLLDDVVIGRRAIENFEVRHAFDHLGLRVMLLNARRLMEAIGDEPLVILSFEDVTHRSVAEEALKQSEARKDAILKSALDAIITMDQGGRLVDFNLSAEQIFACARADVVGRLLPDCIVPERLREKYGRALLHSLATGEGEALNRRIEVTALRASGEEFPAELAIIPIPGSDPPMFTAFLRDITERKQAEQAQAERAEDLIRADRSKDEFLAMLAHELRNPLGPMRNAAVILQTPQATGEERLQAQYILGRQIDNMTRMIDDLLDVSRITEGKIVLQTKHVALADVLLSAANLAAPAVTARDQELRLELPDPPVYLMGDPTRLEQVFGNLLANACKYSDCGCHIWLSAERSPSEVTPPQVIVRVRDDGIGISSDLLPRVFELFVQASRTLDRSHGGLGIGLTLVDRIVRLHGGRVEAHSRGLGHGSEFVVHLPVTDEPPPLLPQVVGTQEAPRRILIVDDNKDSANTLATLHRRRGHDTRVAFTGPEALNLAEEFLPEVVLLDIGLPEMDGFEVARRLRLVPALAAVYLVAISGYGRSEDRAAAAKAGFDEYLVKPVDLEALCQCLDKAGAAQKS